LKPGSPLTKKTSLKSVSTKRAGREVEYREQCRVFLAENPVCQVCRDAPSTDKHHRSKRDGARLVDFENIMALCNPCHRHIHANPAWAYDRGFLVRVNRKIRD
jgi:5-methylcytosine-specific restriction endonuclease McrA